MAGGQGRERGWFCAANPLGLVRFLSWAWFTFHNANEENTRKDVLSLQVLTKSTGQHL